MKFGQSCVKVLARLGARKPANSGEREPARSDSRGSGQRRSVKSASRPAPCLISQNTWALWATNTIT